MPGAYELLGLVLVVFIIWVGLKMARVAIKLLLFVAMLGVVVGALYWVFMR
jgi:hypothetical protein